LFWLAPITTSSERGGERNGNGKEAGQVADADRKAVGIEEAGPSPEI
jgi:hypothetical protein